jgi:hypothetical protein
VYRYFARGHRRAGRRLDAARTYLRLAAAEQSLGDAGRAFGVFLGGPALALASYVKRGPLPRMGRSLPVTASIATPAWLAFYQ